MHGAKQGEESARRDTEDLMFNKRESLWHGIRARPSLNIKEPGGELDGWRIPSEVQTEERQKKRVMRKGKGIFECFWVSVCVLKCWSEWQKSKQRRTQNTFFYLKWRHSSLCPLWQSMDNTNLRYIKSKSLKSLTVAALLQLFKSSTSLTPCSHTASQQLSPSFPWLLKITFKITESLNRLFKLDRAYGSASLHMPLATMH